MHVHGKRLIEWHLEALARAGVREVVINTAWLEDQFPRRWATARATACITYSFEGRDHGGALETAGGIAKALPQLGDVFWVVSGDVFVPDFASPPTTPRLRRSDALGQLWLVRRAPTTRRATSASMPRPRPAAHRRVQRWTWASVGLFRAALFRDIASGRRWRCAPKLERP